MLDRQSWFQLAQLCAIFAGVFVAGSAMFMSSAATGLSVASVLFTSAVNEAKGNQTGFGHTFANLSADAANASGVSFGLAQGFLIGAFAMIALALLFWSLGAKSVRRRLQ